MNRFLIASIVVSAVSIPVRAEEQTAASPFEALMSAVETQDVEKAQQLFPTAEVISWFNGDYRLESFEVMMENFKDSKRLADIEANNGAFAICDGKAYYIVQYRETEEGGIQIFYGTSSDTPPPPLPFSMRGTKSHCDGVVRYVGGF